MHPHDVRVGLGDGHVVAVDYYPVLDALEGDAVVDVHLPRQLEVPPVVGVLGLESSLAEVDLAVVRGVLQDVEPELARVRAGYGDEGVAHGQLRAGFDQDVAVEGEGLGQHRCVLVDVPVTRCRGLDPRYGPQGLAAEDQGQGRHREGGDDGDGPLSGDGHSLHLRIVPGW